MVFKDYYKILGLESNRVSMTQIKIAYRDQAKKYHPDINPKYEERFKDINEAYKILSDASSKRKYDRQWNRNVGRKNDYYQKNKRKRGALKEDFMNILFGIPTEQPYDKKESIKSTKGENVETEIPISIEEGFKGKTKTIGINYRGTSKEIQGSGSPRNTRR